MSRKDSRHVNCAKAMTRNKSAQPRVRTPASPLWRSTMRPNLFHGTNSMTCANSVLPTFMRHPRSVKPESLANVENEIQIVDTHKSLITLVGIGFAAGWLQLNRTLVSLSLYGKQWVSPFPGHAWLHRVRAAGRCG